MYGRDRIMHTEPPLSIFGRSYPHTWLGKHHATGKTVVLVKGNTAVERVRRRAQKALAGKSVDGWSTTAFDHAMGRL